MSNSKENTQNPSCCKFFTKIKEWICARKNKNSKNVEETTTHRNLNRLRQQRKQIQQSKQKTDYLEIFSKLIGISTILGILSGGFVIYIYLLKINQLSILPDVISNPSSLIAAITIFILIYIIIISLHYLLLHSFLPESSSAIQDSLNSKSTKSNHSVKIIFRLYNICISLIIFWVIFRFLTIFLEYLFPQTNNTGIYLISFILILFIFLLTLIDYYRKNLLNLFNLNDKESFIYFTRLLITLIMIIYLMILGMGDKTRILNFTHIIEIPEDSSWYLLHNNFQQNNGSQETNGIDKNDLIKLKQNFKCSILSEKEKEDKNINCSPIPEQRNNALYGYMAWNLGDIKFFCPATTDNTKADSTKTKDEDSKSKNEDPKSKNEDPKTKEQEAADELAAKEADKLTEECIIISGKALQIMPKSYISTDTDGIDDSDPDNTGHDDPTIDIKTDVKFKNDLNAQSNAGLNNFNIQPVLPIQSNAKNMSIQIHYGSCNHDSPRNKDGHPDIGYTDKKICQ